MLDLLADGYVCLFPVLDDLLHGGRRVFELVVLREVVQDRVVVGHDGVLQLDLRGQDRWHQGVNGL